MAAAVAVALAALKGGEMTDEVLRQWAWEQAKNCMIKNEDGSMSYPSFDEALETADAILAWMAKPVIHDAA